MFDSRTLTNDPALGEICVLLKRGSLFMLGNVFLLCHLLLQAVVALFGLVAFVAMHCLFVDYSALCQWLDQRACL